MQHIGPTHDLVLGDPGTWRLLSGAFAPDGRLYAEVADNTLNLWDLLVWHWPELLGAALALALLVLMVPVVRVLRRPQVPGAPHCRRCNYHLAGLAPGLPCPECCTDPARRPPIAGRRTRRRLAAPVALAAAAVLAYAALHALRVGRVNGATGMFHWPAPALAAFATGRGITRITQQVARYRFLVEIDPATGHARRIRSFRDGFPPTFRLAPSPDGRAILTVLADGALGLIDPRTRRVLTRTDPLPPNPSGLGPAWTRCAGWLDDTTPCVQFFDPAAEHTLFAWNTADGSLRPIARIPVPGGAAPGRYGPARRTAHLVPGSSPPVWLEVPDNHPEGLKHGDRSTIRVRAVSDGAALAELTGTFWAGTAPVPLPDGDTFFIRGWAGAADIRMWSISQRAQIGGLNAPGFMGTLQDGPAGLASHAPSGRLFVATTNPDSLHVRDTNLKRWIARLDFTIDGLPDDYPLVSPDGRWAVIGLVETGTAGAQRPTFKQHLLIFDLAPLNPAEAKPGS